MSADEGYLTLACGSRRYLGHAINLKLSFKRFDPSRPICSVHDEHLPQTAEDLRMSDDYKVMTDDPAYAGCVNKLRLSLRRFGGTPSERTRRCRRQAWMMKLSKSLNDNG